MKKILFIMQIPPPLHGASVMNYAIQKSSIINNKYDCDYINLSSSGSISDLGKHNIQKYFKLVGIYMNVLLHLTRKKYDICYITLTPTGVGFLKDSIVVLLAKLFHRKIVFHFHGKGIKDYNVDAGFILKKYIHFIFNKVDIIHLSNKLLDDIEDIESVNQKHIVANGVEKNRKCNSREKQKNNTFKILFLSSMIEAKGVISALKTINILHEQNKNFEMTFVGAFRNEHFEKKVFEFVSLNKLDSVITFLGSIYGDEKYEIFKGHDVFFAPTKNDAFPLVILEAMQCGIPIITTHQGGIPDIICDGKTGFLIEENNINGFVEKLKFFMQNRNEIENFGQRARIEFLQKYTLEIFEKNLINVFQKIIK